MKAILAIATIVLVIVLGLQTYESARFHKAAIICDAAETSGPECVGLGSVGSVRKSGVVFVAEAFVRHARALPSEIRERIRNHAAKYHL